MKKVMLMISSHDGRRLVLTHQNTDGNPTFEHLTIEVKWFESVKDVARKATSQLGLNLTKDRFRINTEWKEDNIKYISCDVFLSEEEVGCCNLSVEEGSAVNHFIWI